MDIDRRMEMDTDMDMELVGACHIQLHDTDTFLPSCL